MIFSLNLGHDIGSHLGPLSVIFVTVETVISYPRKLTTTNSR